MKKAFTRYTKRNVAKTLKEKGLILEKHLIDSKIYKNGDTHSIDENNNSFPLVIVKLRSRGYTVVDVARNTCYVASEVKLNEVCTVSCLSAGWRKKGRFFFDTDPRDGLSVGDESGNLAFVERSGVLKWKKEGSPEKGSEKGNIEKSPVPPGFVFSVTR